VARSGDLLAAARHYMTPAGLRVSLGANGPETRSYLWIGPRTNSSHAKRVIDA